MVGYRDQVHLQDDTTGPNLGVWRLLSGVHPLKLMRFDRVVPVIIPQTNKI
jgi:hypothetical protein